MCIYGLFNIFMTQLCIHGKEVDRYVRVYVCMYVCMYVLT